MVPRRSVDYFLLRRSLKVGLAADPRWSARKSIDASGSDSSSRGAESWRRTRDRDHPRATS
jgi:hypothetical protein